MCSKVPVSELAVNGAPKVRTEPFPGRHLLGTEEKEAVNKLFDDAIASGNAIGYNGKMEEEYCRKFAESLGGGFADGVNSGTTAVYVALRALDPEPFSEIIVPCVTDPGGIMPVVMLNCIPMVADTVPGSYNTGPEQIEELISPRTSAIVVPHIAGTPADVTGIMAIASKHNIPVVEDCAQAHGAKLNGQPLGTFGSVAAFSTMFGKHHCTGGQGGVVFTKNEEIYRKVRWASDRGKPFGLPAGSTNCIPSLNFNLDEIGAAIGIAQLDKLPGIVKRRRAVVNALADGLNGLKAISAPPELPGAESSRWFWIVEFNPDALSCTKEEFCNALAAEGLTVQLDYRNGMPHKMYWFKNRAEKFPWNAPQYQGDPNREFPCPNAEVTMDKLIKLAISESWGEQEVNDILEIFRKVESAYTP